MISVQTRNRVDYFAVTFFMIKELLLGLKADQWEEEIVTENEIIKEKYGKFFSEIPDLPLIIPQSLADDPMCSSCHWRDNTAGKALAEDSRVSDCATCTWHAVAASEALTAWKKTTGQDYIEGLTEDDGVDPYKLRKLTPYIFNEIGKHYSYAEINGSYESTVRDSCCRRFGLTTDELYELFLKGLSSTPDDGEPNPFTIELENHFAGDENSTDLENYVKTIGKCVHDRLFV